MNKPQGKSVTTKILANSDKRRNEMQLNAIPLKTMTKKRNSGRGFERSDASPLPFSS